MGKTSEAVRVLIIDDEPIARDYIQGFLEGNRSVCVVGEASNGFEALELIIEKRPDLIFLDIQMPEMDGFEVLKHIDQTYLPHIIFVTAYDEYALKAFEVNAIDYLLKPFDRVRFEKALEKVLDYIRLQKARDFENRVKSLLRNLSPPKKIPQRLAIRSRGRIHFLKIEDIRFIQAAGNYVALHTGEKEHLLRETLKSMEDKLDKDKFVRVHRSTIVNKNYIRELELVTSGEYCIHMSGGERLMLSRKYREKLLNRL